MIDQIDARWSIGSSPKGESGNRDGLSWDRNCRLLRPEVGNGGSVFAENLGLAPRLNLQAHRFWWRPV